MCYDNCSFFAFATQVIGVGVHTFLWGQRNRIMIYSKVGWLKCPRSTLLMAAKWLKEEKSTYKRRDVALSHNDIMNIVAALLKGFFILMMTVLRRSSSKRCKMNYLHASAHVSPTLPSILLPRISDNQLRQQGQAKCDVHAGHILMPETYACFLDCVSVSKPGKKPLNHMIHK